MFQCPSCNAEVAPESVYCHRCGLRLDTLGELTPEANSETPNEPQQRFEAAAQQSAAKSGAAAGDSERELWRGTFSAQAMVGTWIGCGLGTIALLVVWLFWWPGWTWWLVLLLLVAVLWLYPMALLFYRQLSVRYRLTNQRFFHESGIFRRVTDRIENIDMDDVTVVQGFVERFFGVGTIRITSSDRTSPDLSLPGIDDATRVASLIDDARRAERRRRGLHIEQI